MSFVRAEDRPRVVKLVGAIVAVFGCAAWRVAGAMPQTAPAPSSPVVVAETAPADVTVAKPAKPPKPGETDEIDATPLFAASTIDPFRTVGPARKASPPPLAAAPTGTIPPLPLPLPPLPLPPAGPLAPPAAPPGAEPPAAPMRVTGILAGPNATAVVEIGGGVRVVRQGQRLPGGFAVSRIDPTTVTLRRGGESVVLDVGE